MIDLNAFPEFPICGFCADLGLTHDCFNGFRFCTCPAGQKRATTDSQACELANAARERMGAL